MASCPPWFCRCRGRASARHFLGSALLGAGLQPGTSSSLFRSVSSASLCFALSAFIPKSTAHSSADVPTTGFQISERPSIERRIFPPLTNQNITEGAPGSSFEPGSWGWRVGRCPNSTTVSGKMGRKRQSVPMFDRGPEPLMPRSSEEKKIIETSALAANFTPNGLLLASRLRQRLGSIRAIVIQP